MRLAFLTNNADSLVLACRLREHGEQVIVQRDPLDAEFLRSQGIEFAVSYNYRHLIGPETIAVLPGRIVNLHISLLPWNRGADPNLWSFLDDTPKGVTIHHVDAALDTGALLLQEELSFDPKRETLASTYASLHARIVDLFMANWTALRAGELRAQPQPAGGSMHYKRELDAYRDAIDWDAPIETVLELLAQLRAGR